MDIRIYKAYNPNSKISYKPSEIIRKNFFSINIVMMYLQKIRPQLVSDYVLALKKRLADDIGMYHFDLSKFDLNEITKKFDSINTYQDLKELVMLFTCKYLNLLNDCNLEQEREGLTLDWLRAQFILQYHRTGTFIDILERDEGIQLWKDIVYAATKDSLESSEGEIHPPIKEFTEMWIKRGEEDENNTSDFTLFIYDDYKVLLKVDRCGVHEAVKHLDDQEIAFLSYCWTGFAEDMLNQKVRRRRTTQTLHLNDYCDEFYWNNDVHPNEEQPNLDELMKIINQSKL